VKQTTVVVKIGTSSLTDDRGRLDEGKLQHHAAAISRLKQAGMGVVLVSSGAIAAGFHELGMKQRPRTLAGKQAAAAVGQGMLIQRYREAFARLGHSCAQVLLTRGDFDHRMRYMNALNTLGFLLERGSIPIINENDSISVDEIRWGDNDFLASLVAGLLQSEWLLLVTNTDGLYTENPWENPAAEKIHRLTEVDDHLLSRLDDSKSALGSGGMRSKLLAARRASAAGTRVYIGTAVESEDWMEKAVAGEGSGTYIASASHRISRKEHWIAAHSLPKGMIHVDKGAAQALLEAGGSLLPCGITRVSGEFEPGSVVEVLDPQGRSIGRGLTRYGADLLQQVKGWQTEAVHQIDPHVPDEVIHRDDWVTLFSLNYA
jgi:glutamate 5-kinase